ncbi:cytochrome P450 [Plantactinospora sp. KBS50]|uniref:cytochrome P450 n=1 Tax=Plantactinospora sp. KBS50 TaxID=2024580 RepID=UPI003511E2FA
MSILTITTTEPPHYPVATPAGRPFDPMSSADRDRFADGVHRVELPTGGWAWLLTRHADVRYALRHCGLSADVTRPGFPLLRPPVSGFDRIMPGSFIRMDGAEHARLRRMLTPEFMVRHIDRIEPLIRRTVDEALTAMLAAGPPADLVGSFALPVPSEVICHLLGVPYADHVFFQQRSRTLLDRTSSAEDVRSGVADLRDYLTDLVERKLRGASATDDLLGRLAADRVATGELDAEELVGIALLLLIAGHETTANMLGLSTALLLRDPGRYAALREDPDRAPAVVEELLRFLSVVRNGLPRLAVEDVEIGGQLIRAGEGVIMALTLANRDAEVFADPDSFDPDRDAHRHLAFGFGVHQCLGQPLARAELRIALVELSRRLPGLALVVAESRLPTRDTSVVFGLDELPVTW